MAGNKVTLRTTFPGDVFKAGDVTVTSAGVDLPSRKAADELLEVAAANGVTLHEVPAEDAAEKKTEGSGS